MRNNTIEVGAHKIGAGCQPFIIAECGSNWKTFDEAKDMVSMAKNTGADAVKFQLYTHEALFGYPGDQPGTMPREWIPLLAEKAKAVRIEFMCTAFSPELVGFLDPYVNIHKVASAELTHVRMLEKLNTLSKPVILSTGASGDYDIKNALDVLNKVPVILMYCESAYPARHIMLENIEDMSLKYNRPVGFSDHTMDIFTIPFEATRKGAVVLEKTVKKRDYSAPTPDQHYALTFGEFHDMVKRIRGNFSLRRTMGTELKMMAMHNRRVIAIKPIPAGQALREGIHYGIFRSQLEETTAYSPFAIDPIPSQSWKGLDGQIAARDIPAGHGIGPLDIVR